MKRKWMFTTVGVGAVAAAAIPDAAYLHRLAAISQRLREQRCVGATERLDATDTRAPAPAVGDVPGNEAAPSP